MERQRSFSIKPTRFLVFSFTIFSFSLLLCFFFSSSSVVKVPAPSFQNAVLQFTGSSFVASVRAPKAHNLVAFTRNSTGLGVKETDLGNTHLRKFGDSSGGSAFHVSSERKVTGDGKNPILLGAQLPNSDNSSGKSSFQLFNGSNGAGEYQIPVLEGAQLWKSTNSNGEVLSLSSVDRKKAGEAQNTISMGTKIWRSGNSPEEISAPAGGMTGRRKSSGCNVFSGRWVFDESYPLYSHRSCPFIDEGFNCQANGRLDRDYMKWRWQPNDCDIPRFA